MKFGWNCPLKPVSVSYQSGPSLKPLSLPSHSPVKLIHLGSSSRLRWIQAEKLAGQAGPFWGATGSAAPAGTGPAGGVGVLETDWVGKGCRNPLIDPTHSGVDWAPERPWTLTEVWWRRGLAKHRWLGVAGHADWGEPTLQNLASVWAEPASASPSAQADLGPVGGQRAPYPLGPVEHQRDPRQDLLQTRTLQPSWPL